MSHSMENGRLAGTASQQEESKVDADCRRPPPPTMVKQWALQLQQAPKAQHHLKQSHQAIDPHQYHFPDPSPQLPRPPWPTQGEDQDQAAEQELVTNWMLQR